MNEEQGPDWYWEQELIERQQWEKCHMNIDEVFAGNALKGSELIGKGDVKLTVSGVTLEQFDEKDRPKPVLSINGTDRTLILNKTNAGIIKEWYGPDTDRWTGQPVTIYHTKTEFQGRRVDAIRVRAQDEVGQVAVPHPTVQPAHDLQSPAPPQPDGITGSYVPDDLDGDIPF